MAIVLSFSTQVMPILFYLYLMLNSKKGPGSWTIVTQYSISSNNMFSFWIHSIISYTFPLFHLSFTLSLVLFLFDSCSLSRRGWSILYRFHIALHNSYTLTVTALTHSISLATSDLVNCNHIKKQWFTTSHSLNQEKKIVRPNFSHLMPLIFKMSTMFYHKVQSYNHCGNYS